MKKFNYLRVHSAFRIACSLLIAFVVTCIIVGFTSEEPLVAIYKLFLGPLQSKRLFFNVVERMIPLVFTGLAMNVILKSGFFNMGADGSFYVGAVIASYFAIKFPLPAGILQIAAFLAAGVIGGLICMLPVLIKKYTNANVTVLSMMFNYIFYYIAYAVVSATLLEQGSAWKSLPFPDSARLGKVLDGTSLHYGFFIMILVNIFMVVLLNKSSFGYKLKLSGSNAHFAKSMGIQYGVVVFISQFIGGALAGLGGAIEMLGLNTRFTWRWQVNYLWDGIVVNLLANQNPAYMAVSAFGLAYLRIGAEVMSRASDVDPELVSFIQGVIIVLVASERFLYFLKKRAEEKQAMEDVAKGEAE